MVRKLLPSEELAHTTVRLESEFRDGDTSTGTGFFFSCLEEGDQAVPVIVTNRHVVDGAIRTRFHMTRRDESGDPLRTTHWQINMGEFARHWISHPNPAIDLVAAPIASVLTKAEASGNPLFYRALSRSMIPTDLELGELGAMESVVMIGYPTGLWDTVNNMPIIRRGVTATHPHLDYEGRSEFMIDAACFPGSSGSPVFLYSDSGWITRDGNRNLGGFRLKLLGVMYAGPQYTAEGEIRIVAVPTGERAVAHSAIPINLGLVIKSARVAEFDDAIRAIRDRERAGASN